MLNYKNKVYAAPGIRYLIECPSSEVCMHMSIAGKLRYAELQSSRYYYYSVQLYDLDHKPFSFPILTGEAGFYTDEEQRFYFHPPDEQRISIPTGVVAAYQVPVKQEVGNA